MPPWQAPKTATTITTDPREVTTLPAAIALPARAPIETTDVREVTTDPVETIAARGIPIERTEAATTAEGRIDRVPIGQGRVAERTGAVIAQATEPTRSIAATVVATAAMGTTQGAETTGGLFVAATTGVAMLHP